MNPSKRSIHKSLAIMGAAFLGLSAPTAGAAPPHVIVWAWERPEDLRFLPATADIAIQTGFVALAGSHLTARGRRFPLLARPGQIDVALVHVQIDPRRPLVWSPSLRDRTVAAILAYAAAVPARMVQVDFEVRTSQRSVLLDVLHGVRAGLPKDTRLSMTALADWCDTEAWLDQTPVDEVAPMLFRMGPGGASLKTRLEAGGDFHGRRCHDALAVSVDAPIERAPAGRRVYLFNPRPWTADDFSKIELEVEAWDRAEP